MRNELNRIHSSEPLIQIQKPLQCNGIPHSWAYLNPFKASRERCIIHYVKVVPASITWKNKGFFRNLRVWMKLLLKKELFKQLE